MTNSKTNTKSNIASLVIVVMTIVFLFTRLYRNSVDYSVGKQGGIWNFILMAFVAFALFSLFFYWKTITKNTIIKLLILYSVTVWFNCLIRLNSFTLTDIYYFVVSSVFVPVLIVSYHIVGFSGNRLVNLIWYLGWALVFALLLFTYTDFFSQYQYYQSADKIALNNSYYAICAIPFFLMKKEKRSVLDLIYVLLSLFVVFISNKRAGFLAVLIGLLVFFVINAKVSRSSSKSFKIMLSGIVLMIIGLVVFYLVDSNLGLNIFSRLSMLFSDGGSGRAQIYGYVWSEICSSKPIDIFFGHGLNSITTLEVSLSSAHNDFLNILYEYGLFPTVLLIAFYFFMFGLLIKMVKRNYDNSGAFAFSLVLSLVFSLVSANLDSQSFSIVLALYWGFELKRWDTKKLEWHKR